MIAPTLALALAAGAVSFSPVPNGEVAASAPVHLGVSLALTHRMELMQLLAAQQDPRSPEYRRWLTPAEFGQRFGQPEETYAAVQAWLEAAGLEVRTMPGRTFIEAKGTAAQVEALLALQLLTLANEPASVHVPNGKPRLPAAFADQVVNISGLDTRNRFHHRFGDMPGAEALGPQDLRRLYNLEPLLDAGFVGQGQQTVVLSTALPPGGGVSIPDVEYYLQSMSDSVIPLNVIEVVPGTTDTDGQQGANTEFELDLSMQSVGNVAGAGLTLLVSPSSEVFTTGAAYIANEIPGATSVSVSLGNCEAIEQLEAPGEPATLQSAVLQGLSRSPEGSCSACLRSPVGPVDHPLAHRHPRGAGRRGHACHLERHRARHQGPDTRLRADRRGRRRGVDPADHRGRRAAVIGLAVPAGLGGDSRVLQPAADAVLPAGRVQPGLPAGPRHLPLVVTLLAAVFVHEHLAFLQVAGVVVVSAGLAFLVFAGRRPGRGAFLAAVGTGLTIAAYTTVDGVGVRASASPVGYIGWLMVLQSLCVPLFAAVRRRDVLPKQPRRILLTGLAAGALSVLAYGLVLWAQTRGALAPIAALRETSVIFGAIIGTLVFREPFGRARITATVLVAAGIVLLNVA